MSPSLKGAVGAVVLAVGMGSLACDRLYEGDGPGAPLSVVPRLPEVTAQCTQDGTATDYQDEAELRGLLEGVWEYCDGTSPLSRPNVAGIELRPGEGRYHFLRRLTDGSLTRMSGFDSEGDLEVAPRPSQPDQLEVRLGPPASFITEAEFTVRPRKLRFAPSVYVLREAGTSLAERCEQDGAIVTYSTQAELRALVTGRWAYCGGVSPLSRPGTTGIELDPAGGSYHFLEDDGEGGYRRMAGFDGGGSLTIYQPSASTQWRLSFGPPASFDTPADLMTGPEKLRLNPSIYVRIP